MIGPQHQKQDVITIFNNATKGLLCIRDGLVAFGGEASSIQNAASHLFDASEICNLKQKTLMNTPMYMILPKNSQYKEMFNVALLRSFEVGILNRILMVYQKEKGVCLAGVTLFSVPFSKVRTAFYVLGGKFSSF